MTKAPFVLIHLFVGLISCGQPKYKTCMKEISLWPGYDFSEQTTCSFSWGKCAFPDFLPKSFDASPLVPGDVLGIEYTGELFYRDTSPLQAYIEGGAFISMKVEYGSVSQVRIHNGIIVPPLGISLESMITSDFAISPSKALVPITSIDSAYLVCSALDPSLARILLTYHPRTTNAFGNP